MQHSTLVSLGVRWLSRKCSVVLYEFATEADENPDVIGWATTGSILIECKLTRSDFLRDAKKAVRKNPRAGMGHRRYYLCPPDVIQVKDLPPKWGLLWVSGRDVIVKRETRGHPERNLLAEVRFLSSMLRRAQIRIGSRPLSEWLRGENRFEAKRGVPPNRLASRNPASASVNIAQHLNIGRKLELQMKKSVPAESAAAAFIDEKINELSIGQGAWRGKTLAKVRKIIHEADPEIVEEVKWMGTPVFSHGGIVCTGETYKSVVKMTFAKGAALKDPSGLFNSSLEGNVRRAIDIHEGEKINKKALKDLIRAAVELNLAAANRKSASNNQSKPVSPRAKSKRAD